MPKNDLEHDYPGFEPGKTTAAKEEKEDSSDPSYRTDELQMYMRQFRRYPVLRDQNEFNLLLDRWRSHNDTKARDQIVYGNIRLVLSIALPMQGRGLSLPDMLQEGVLGLMRALQKFDPGKGARFSTCAFWWIKQAIQRAFADKNEGMPFRLPVHTRERINVVRRCQNLFHETYGYFPTAQELHDFIHEQDGSEDTTQTAEDLTLSAIREFQGIIGSSYMSLNFLLESQNGGGFCLEDVLPDRNLDLASTAEARHLYLKIITKIDSLEPRSATIIRLRYLTECITLEEVGDRFALTRERIRQIENKAIKQLSIRLKMDSGKVKNLLVGFEGLKKLAGALPEGSVPVEKGTYPEGTPLKTLFDLLCEHLIVTPSGKQLVRVPITLLGVRLSLEPGAAVAVLKEMCSSGLIEGRSPWEEIKVIPKTAAPVYTDGYERSRLPTTPPKTNAGSLRPQKPLHTNKSRGKVVIRRQFAKTLRAAKP